MDIFRVSENIVPVSEFKSKAAEWLRYIGKRKGHLVITQKGKAAGVLLSPKAYDELMERLRFMESVEEGLADIGNGRVESHESLVAEMTRRYGK